MGTDRQIIYSIAYTEGTLLIKVKELPLVKLTGRPWWYRLARPFIALLPASAQDRIYHKYK